MVTDEKIKEAWWTIKDDEFSKLKRLDDAGEAENRAAIRLYRLAERVASRAVCELCGERREIGADGHANLYCGKCFAKEMFRERERARGKRKRRAD